MTASPAITANWTTTSVPDAKAAPLTLAEKVLLIAAVIMFVVLNCGLITVGILPVKPRDATLGLIALTALPLLLCRKYLCLPALLLLAIPVWRLADAAFLHRYDIQEGGSHYAGVTMMFTPVLITAITLLVYSTRVGKSFAIISSAVLITLLSLVDLYEWLGFAQYTSVPGRMAGFLVHPNTAPTFQLLCLTILYTLNRSFWWNIAFTVLTAIPTTLSLSRSCMTMFAGVVLLYLMANWRERWRGLVILICAIPPVMAAWLGVVEATATHGRLRRDEFVEGRFEAIYRLDFDGLKSAERGKDLQDGWEAVWKSPMWGYGPGATKGELWQPHNQIVAIWLDLGILGLLTYLGQLFWPLILSASRGFQHAWCLLPAFLDIPCQHWLVEMPCYWFALAVCYSELMPHRFAISFRGDE